MADPGSSAPEDESRGRVDEDTLGRKLRRWGRWLGRRVVHESLLLWYAYRDPDTPRRAKLIIAAALAYLIMPLDVLPDPLFVDDAVVIARALLAIRMHVKPEHEELARERAGEWIGR